MEAYRRYRVGHRRARALVEAAAAATNIEVRQDALRASAVVVCAEFEAFLRELVQERFDAVVNSWNLLVPAEKRLVAGAIVVQLAPLPHDPLDVDAKNAETVASVVRRVAGWLDEPGRFAREAPDVRLRGFHDVSDVAKTVSRILVQLRDDGIGFFEWLASHGVDANAYKLALEALVDLRMDTAHQLRLGRQPTPEDLRLYQRRSAALVRRIVSYIGGRGCGSTAKAS